MSISHRLAVISAQKFEPPPTHAHTLTQRRVLRYLVNRQTEKQTDRLTDTQMHISITINPARQRWWGLIMLYFNKVVFLTMMQHACKMHLSNGWLLLIYHIALYRCRFIKCAHIFGIFPEECPGTLITSLHLLWEELPSSQRWAELLVYVKVCIGCSNNHQQQKSIYLFFCVVSRLN